MKIRYILAGLFPLIFPNSPPGPSVPNDPVVRDVWFHPPSTIESREYLQSRIAELSAQPELTGPDRAMLRHYRYRLQNLHRRDDRNIQYNPLAE